MYIYTLPIYFVHRILQERQLETYMEWIMAGYVDI